MCCSTWREGVGTIKMGADNQNHGDLALVNVSAEGHGGGTKVWWGGPYATNRIPVIDRRYPVYGDITCLSGSTSGVRCGANIQYKNVAHVYGSGNIVRNVDGATSNSTLDCPQPGDSGGSVVIDESGSQTEAKAVGIVSGITEFVDGGCTHWFTGLDEAKQAWGGGPRLD